MTEPAAGVLFDLDNTLIDRDLAFASWARHFVAAELRIDDPVVAEHEAAWLMGLEVDGAATTPAFFELVRDRHPRFSGDPGDRAARFPGELREHIAPLDARTLQMLADLDGAGIPWGIVTNGSPTQLKKIELVGLERAASIIVSGIIGIRKPDRAIFEAAAHGIGLDPTRVLFVGDNVEADIIGAANAGMRTAWMHRGRTWVRHESGIEPDFVLDHVAEVAEILSSAKPMNQQGFSRVTNVS